MKIDRVRARGPRRRLPRGSGEPGWLLLIACMIWGGGGGCILDSEPSNHPPTIESLSANPPQVYPGNRTQVTVVASDPDDDPLTHIWSANSGAFPLGAEGAVIFWEAPDSEGLCSLTVRVGDASESVTGHLEIPVVPAVPILDFGPERLDFADATDTLEIQIRNAGGAVLSWSISTDAAWLIADPLAGTTTDETDPVTLTVDRSGLDPGSYVAGAGIHSNGGDAEIAVTLEVTGPPIWGYTIIDSFPHDRAAFTQGLAIRGDILFEGTGRLGQSTLRAVELATGHILRIHELYSRYFGEGVTVFGRKVIQLTLNANRGYVYDVEDFGVIESFSYTTQGWGLTHDGQRLIMSDGSSLLHFLDPETYEPIGQVEVLDRGEPVDDLNELEYVSGEVFANIWKSEQIARIDPQTGQVVGWIDLQGLKDLVDYGGHIDVLNGIAYDTENDRLFVTGKLWPLVFQIELVSPATHASWETSCSAGPSRPTRSGRSCVPRVSR